MNEDKAIASSILKEIEQWQIIHDWFTDHNDFDAEAEHVKSIIKAITLGTKLNPQGPSQ
jgi:hypothetical protein